MSEKTVKILIVSSALILLLTGGILYKVFDYQGYSKENNQNKKIITYDIKDYTDTTPIVFSNYNNVYTSINVSKVTLKNLDQELTTPFLNEEEELINYITGYYNEVIKEDNYTPNNTATSTIKMQINNAILSIFYELDFHLDDTIFENNSKKYIIATNIDLGTNKLLTADDLLKKYNYTKEYIAEKIYNDDILISSNQIVIDKNTNISLTKEDIERKKEEYINKIISEFNNIIKVYVENKSLTLAYNKQELRNIFFDNKFDSEIVIRYLK